MISNTNLFVRQETVGYWNWSYDWNKPGANTRVRKKRYRFGNDTSTSIQAQFHFTNLLVNFLHKQDNKINNLVLVHLVGVEVGDQEANVVPLPWVWSSTGTGFLRRITKFSARIIMKRVNLWQSMRSISSACLILIETRSELMDPSIRTCSFSLREMMTGFKMVSGEKLELGDELPSFYFGFVVSLYVLRGKVL